MKKETKNIDAPAFPPQLMQDNFGQVVALVPGMTKLEFAAIILLPSALNIKKPITKDGEFINKYQAAIHWAKRLFQEIEKDQEHEKNTLHLVD